MSDITFTIIKPEIVGKGLEGEVLDRILKAGFVLSALKLYHLTLDEARRFYLVHENRPFYKNLVEYMSSGPVIVAVLKRNNAVAAFRELIGNTDPAIAAPGSIRQRYGTDITRNAVHGSDSDENAVIESHFFFSGLERF